MYACVLIPKSLSLVLSLHPNPANVLEMSAAVWSNLHLTPGTLLHPDEGELRLDRLEVYGVLGDDDIRRKYGCFDAVHEVEGQKVRHCNWVRFVRESNDPEKVNVIGSKVKGHPFFQVIKFIKPNDEVVALFPDDDAGESASSDEAEHVTSSPAEGRARGLSHALQEAAEEERLASDSEDEQSDQKGESPLPVAEALSRSNCQEFMQSKDNSLRKFEDDFSDECERGDMDKPVLTEIETDRASPRETLVENPQPGKTEELRQDFDKTPSPREDRAILCEAYEEVSPCHLTPANLPSPVSLPDPQQPADGAPSRRGRERTWWLCDTCPKKFDRPSLLKRHIRTHTGEKPHACDVCGKAFSTSSSLNTHRRIHSGEKPHQCPVCGKRFTASSNLYYHRMTHNKEKPHKCQLCSKSFPTPGDLRSHMYIHSGSWPYRCDVCNRGFSKHTNLRNHVLLHSGDKPHVCVTCGKRFALLCNLKTHLKTHAGEGASASCCECGQVLSDNLKMAAKGLCVRCFEDSGKNDSQKRKENLPGDSKSDFSISKLTATSPLKPHVTNLPRDASSRASTSSSSSTPTTSPGYGQFHGHRPWLSPMSSSHVSCTSSPVMMLATSHTSPSAATCGPNSVPAIPPYLLLSNRTSAAPPAFFAPEVMSRESFMPIAHAPSSYYASPASGTWKQIIGQAF